MDGSQRANGKRFRSGERGCSQAYQAFGERVVSSIDSRHFPTFLIEQSGGEKIVLRLGQGVALGKMWMGLTLGGLAGTVLSFFVVDRYPVVCLRLSGLITAAGLLAGALCESWRAMYPFLLVASAGINVAQIAALASTQVAAPGNTGRLIASYLAVQLGAYMVAPLAVSALLPSQLVAQHHAHTRFSFGLACLGIAFAAMAIATPRAARTLHSETINQEAPALKIAPSNLWLLILFSALASVHPAVDTAFYQWSTKWFTDSFAVHAFPPVWILSGSAAGYCLGRVALALLPEAFWERRLLILPGLAGAGFIWAAVSCSSYVPAATLYVCSSVHALEYPVLLGFISRRAPELLGRTLAISGVVYMGMAAGLDYAVGRLVDAFSMTAAMAVLSLGYILFSLLAAAMLAMLKAKKPTTL